MRHRAPLGLYRAPHSGGSSLAARSAMYHACKHQTRAARSAMYHACKHQTRAARSTMYHACKHQTRAARSTMCHACKHQTRAAYKADLNNVLNEKVLSVSLDVISPGNPAHPHTAHLGGPVTPAVHLRASTRHTMTTASSPPLTRVLPSALNASDSTDLQCPCSSASSRPVSKSHSLMRWSSW